MINKISVLNIEGKKTKEISLPSFFSEKVREDLIAKVIETEKSKQPYSPSPVAGKQHSASGIINRRRHVWKSSYGKGISRVPRKIISNRGTQFNWIGAEVSGTVGGRRSHPPKILGMINTKKVNKKEKKVAFISALSATANEKFVKEKYDSMKNKKINNLPFVVEGKISELKTKQTMNLLKNILGDLFEVALQKKTIRAGKGKLRGRKYKKNAGLLIVLGKEEKMKMKGIDVVSAKELAVSDLAKGSPGRLVIYTENAVKELNERLNKEKEIGGNLK
jgi:large subunit ribosomal protein L4e